MPVFLSDPTPATYLVLVALVVVTGAVAARWQDRPRIGLFLAACLLLGGLYLIDKLYASPREEAVAGMGQLLDAVNQRQPDRFLANVSDSFSAYGLKKQDLRRAVELARQFDAKVSATPRTFDRGQVVYTYGPPPAVEIVFDAWAGPQGSDQSTPKHVKATFVQDPDGKYRLQSFKTYNIVQKQVEEPIPGLGK
jgi:hypothetical protein